MLAIARRGQDRGVDVQVGRVREFLLQSLWVP